MPLNENATVSFAKGLSRSATGSMNEPVAEAKLWLVEEDLSPHDVGLKVNDVLLSALSDERARKYRTPNDAFKQLADRATPTAADDTVTVWGTIKFGEPIYVGEPVQTNGRR
ncbi:MAG: hypothetical protein WD049_09005 [Candidatus Paceibacterota bacterium]